MFEGQDIIKDQDQGGEYVCPICGFKIPYEVDMPRNDKHCPRCGMRMKNVN